MKRIWYTIVAAIVMCVAFAGPALADYPPTPNGGQGQPPPPAFTGASISLGLIVVGALVLVGVAALIASRRRSTAVAE